MSNRKVQYNKYECQKGTHYHPENPLSDKNGCMKDSDMNNEKYGSFSLSAAVRRPFYDLPNCNPNIVNPKLDGVS
jgi:hypothetical protein